MERIFKALLVVFAMALLIALIGAYVDARQKAYSGYAPAMDNLAARPRGHHWVQGNVTKTVRNYDLVKEDDGCRVTVKVSSSHFSDPNLSTTALPKGSKYTVFVGNGTPCADFPDGQLATISCNFAIDGEPPSMLWCMKTPN